MSHSRCVVKLYEKCTSNSPVLDRALYLQPLKKPKQGDDRLWYMRIAISAHTLSKTVPRLCEEAGLEGFFTNHSLRASCASRLFENGVDEQLITERTGHRSLAIRQYKRTSNKLVRCVSDTVVDDKKRLNAPQIHRAANATRKMVAFFPTNNGIDMTTRHCSSTADFGNSLAIICSLEKLAA
ncbi:hypothetical protein ScPMuIL_016016 [Solemya velum]